MTKRWGAIEGGGTKFLCAVGESADSVTARLAIPTTSSDETLARVIAFFRAQGALDALGVAMFGPLDLERGAMLDTPKPGWSGVAIKEQLEAALHSPVVVDTDVNAAALAEWNDGAGRHCDPFVYVTVGTGIGGGLLVDGEPVHGLMHPEMGHVLVPRYVDASGVADNFRGACPFHGACVEGLASGTAIRARVGKDASELSPEHEAWNSVSDALAHLVLNITLTTAAQRVALGGGVMRQTHLLPRIRERVRALANGYVKGPRFDALEEYVVAPRFSDAGLRGAFALAMRCT